MGIGAAGEESSVGERVLGLVGSRKLGKTGIHWRQSASEFQIIEVPMQIHSPALVAGDASAAKRPRRQRSNGDRDRGITSEGAKWRGRMKRRVHRYANEAARESSCQGILYQRRREKGQGGWEDLAGVVVTDDGYGKQRGRYPCVLAAGVSRQAISWRKYFQLVFGRVAVA